jgi:hypothetical protein
MCQTTFSPPIYSDRGKLAIPEKPKKRKRTAAQNGTTEEVSLESNADGSAEAEEKITEIPVHAEETCGEVPPESHPPTVVPEYMTAMNDKTDPEYLSELERFYWRNLSFQSTMYGADLEASIFTDNPDNKWDMSRLESLLGEVQVSVPGVTTPYLYFGMYKATFSWHVEDMDLFSINYIHFGAPKIWYVVPPAERIRFEQLAASYFYDEAQICPEFTRHKICVISPNVLEKNHISVHRLVQKSNEFVITFPGAYHQGWNTDFNCAEAINFATPAWIDFGRAARFCECVQDSVAIDVNGIFGVDENFKMPRKAKPKKKAPLPKFLPNFSTKKVKTLTGKAKKSNDILAAAKKEKKVWELPKPKCVLCPLGDSVQFPLMPTDKSGVWAHVECGAYIPETRVELIEEGLALIDHQINAELAAEAANGSNTVASERPVTFFISDGPQVLDTSVSLDQSQEKNGEEPENNTFVKEKSVAPYRVLDISDVPMDRKRLKCSYCQWDGPHTKDLGACIQCTKVKLVYVGEMHAVVPCYLRYSGRSTCRLKRSRGISFILLCTRSSIC